MKDTSPDMEKKFNELMLKKTGAERLMMGCSMHDLSKKLVKSSILQNNASISTSRLRREVFLRFYKNDFEPKQLQTILNQLGE